MKQLACKGIFHCFVPAQAGRQRTLLNSLEVSRQTVSAWENYDGKDSKKGVKLSRVQYLAIRKLLDDEIAKDLPAEGAKKKQHILGTMLEVLVDHPDQYTSEDVNAILGEAELIVALRIISSLKKGSWFQRYGHRFSSAVALS